MRRLLLLAFIWGWSFLFIKVAVEGMTPTTVAFARVALGASVLHVYVRWRGLVIPRDRTFWRHVSITAVFANVFPFVALAWGEQRITSALTSVLNASTPLFTALAAAVLLGERLTTLQFVGLAVGLGGVFAAAGVGGNDFADSSVAGSMASVVAGAGYGIAFTYMKRNLLGYPAEIASVGQLTAATIILAPAAIVTSSLHGIDAAPHRILAVVLLGTVGTGVAYVLSYRVVADLGSTRASLVTYIIPVVAVIVGVVLLDEEFHVRILGGGLLIVLGIAMVNHRARLPAPPTAAVALLAVAGIAGLLVACGDTDEGACGPVRRERLDPNSALHLLPGAPEPEYLSEPPTSGAHRSGRPAQGVQARPLARPDQVAVLEAGGVLIQHSGLDEDDVQALEDLGADAVVVAPNPDLSEPVVITAWLARQSCEGVNVETLRRFAATHASEGGHQ